MILRAAGPGLLALLLAGCVTAEPYQRPLVKLPADWRQADAASQADGALDGLAWWQAFADPTLRKLQADALQANLDLQIAISHMLAARDGVTIAASQKSVQLSLGAAPVDAAAVSAVNRKAGLYEIGFSARYELDFWGRIANQVDAAKAAQAASVFDAGTVQIALQAALARGYFRLRALDEQIALQQQRGALADEALRLAQLRAAAGRTALEPVRAATSMRDAAQAQLAQQRRERRLAEMQLALLLGQAPEFFELPPLPLRGTVSLPSLPALLPATVIARRPDLRAAEQRLREAHADVAAARAALLPKISLSAELGLVSGPLSAPLRGSRGLFGIGPEIDAPILDGGRRRAEVDARAHARAAALLEYRKAVLAALADVESALLAQTAAREQAARVETAQRGNAQAAAALDARLAAGRGSRPDVLAAQARALDDETAAVDSYLAQLDSRIALFAALGGGWTEPQLPAPAGSRN
ncbi:MAG: efflux transporter outer membrane subunit [Nevskia sp.]